MATLSSNGIHYFLYGVIGERRSVGFPLSSVFFSKAYPILLTMKRLTVKALQFASKLGQLTANLVKESF